MIDSTEMFQTMILPILDYIDVVWHGCGMINSDTLESLQHRAAKLINFSTCWSPY